MSKVDMKYANSVIYGKQSDSSHKNLLADMLNELAEVLDFNMLLLREDYSEAKGYIFDEEDIKLLSEMADKAKGSEGKRIRCKDYSLEYADTVHYFQNAFLTLAKKNGVPEDTLFEAEYKIGAKTEFIVLKRDLIKVMRSIEPDLTRKFFAPTDYLPDEDDELTKTDIFAFLAYMLYACHNFAVDEKTMKGVYWCFVEERQGRNRDAFIGRLHELSADEKEKLVESAMHQYEFESRLQEDDEYVDTIRKFIDIESGKCKLQDRKKALPLAKKLSEIMDRNADGFLTTEEYAKGEPDFKKKQPRQESIRDSLMESWEALLKSISFYREFKAYRKTHPFTSEDERIIEICYRQRFDEDMF